MKLHSIQYLRAFAAITVVIYHFGESLGYKVENGGFGVDIFFVISGFVMALVVSKPDVDAWSFMRDRLIRIVPLYWLCTLLIAAGATLKPNLFPLDHPAPSHVVLSLLFFPHYSPTGSIFPLLGQGWTLTYEMFFYVIISIFIVLTPKKIIVFVTVALLFSVSIGYFNSFSTLAARSYTSPLLLEFLAGLWFYELYRMGRIRPSFGLPLLALGTATLVYSLAVEPLTLKGLIPAMFIPATCLVAGTLSLNNVISFNRMGVRLGDASYSLYLTHWFSMLGTNILFVKLQLPPVLIFPVALAAAIVVSLLCYAHVERPMSQALKRRAAPSVPAPSSIA